MKTLLLMTLITLFGLCIICGYLLIKLLNDIAEPFSLHWKSIDVAYYKDGEQIILHNVTNYMIDRMGTLYYIDENNNAKCLVRWKMITHSKQ